MERPDAMNVITWSNEAITRRRGRWTVNRVYRALCKHCYWYYYDGNVLVFIRFSYMQKHVNRLLNERHKTGVSVSVFLRAREKYVWFTSATNLLPVWITFSEWGSYRYYEGYKSQLWSMHVKRCKDCSDISFVYSTIHKEKLMKKREIRRKAGKQNFLSGLVVIMQLVLNYLYTLYNRYTSVLSVCS